MKSVNLIILSSMLVLSTGCVMKGTHDTALLELDKTKKSLMAANNKITNQEAHISEQSNEIEYNHKQISKTNNEFKRLQEKKLALQKEFDLALSQLDESESKLKTMRQIEAETKKRNEIYARFVKELQKMIDGGQLTVSIEQGRIVINLPENVLFSSGQAVLNNEGKDALKQIASVLKEFSDRRFQVEGHTDNIPMKNSKRYPTNWELSTARSLSVVHLMVDEGVEAKNVSAAGFSEFHPRANNDEKEGRALNRRIEIIMQPNLEILSNELPKLAS